MKRLAGLRAPRFSEGAYRFLLLLFPRLFRDRFGGAMVCAFGECVADTRRHRGRRALVALWARTVGDVVGTAATLRADQLRRRLGGGARRGRIGVASDGGGLFGALERLGFDLRHAGRSLRRSPGYALAAVTTLALGIGANTAVFSVVQGVLLRPLPFQDPSRLVLLRHDQTGVDDISVGFSVAELETLRRDEAFDALVEYHNMTFTLLGGTEPERVRTGIVSWQYFEFLGVEPLLGRPLRAADEVADAEPILVLSHDYWQRSHGGDPDIVGRSFVLNDRAHRVVGVLPPVPQYPLRHDIYMPVTACPVRSAPHFVGDPSARLIGIVGRVANDGGVEAASSALRRAEADLRHRHSEAYPESAGLRMVAADMHDELTRQARPKLILLVVAALLVLLSGCANVANLSLVRVLRKQRETAVRAALGAGRVRLLRQRLAESLALAAAGGALGVGLAYAALETLVAFAARFTTRAIEVRLDVDVLLFCAAISVLSGLIAALTPSFPTTEKLATALRAGRERTTDGGSVRRTRAWIIGAQVAASVMLLAGAGLTLRSLINLQTTDLGFDAERMVGIHLHMNPAHYPHRDDSRRFVDRVLADAVDLDGVVAVAAASGVPLVDVDDRAYDLEQVGGPPAATPRLRAAIIGITDSYFDTLGMRLTAGEFRARDAAGNLGAVVNRRMADAFWPGASPVGATLRLDDLPPLTVLGVVADARDRVDAPAGPTLYTPLWSAGFGDSLLFRVEGDVEAAAEAIVAAIRRVDPELALVTLALADVRRQAIAPPRLVAMLFSAFAAVAVIVAATGISGLIAFVISERTREIGIRMALGAELEAVRRMLLRQGLRPVVAGLAVGLAGAAGISWLLQDGLFDIAPWDPLTYFGTAAFALIVAAAASALPARRASAISPIVALRAE